MPKRPACQQLRIRAVRSGPPDPGLAGPRRPVHDPPAVRRHRRVLGVDAVVRQLMRAAAVALRSPDFEVAAAAGRAPVQVPIGTECRVPVVRGIVGDLAKFAGGRRHHPQVEVPGTIGGEQNPAAVWRIDRLSIGLPALGQAARCGVRPLGDVLTHGLRLDDDAIGIDDREAPQRVRARVQEPCSRTRLQRHQAAGRARELAGRRPDRPCGADRPSGDHSDTHGLAP